MAYPGTHDNNTLSGWFKSELDGKARKQAIEYFALTEQEGILRGLLRGVLASPAALAIIPLADWLEAGPEARMNTPGKAQGNWQWRAADTALTTELAAEIRTMTVRYFRARKPKAEPAAAAAKEPAAKPDKAQKVRTDAKKAERAVKK